MNPILNTTSYEFESDLGMALFVLICKTLDKEREQEYRYSYNPVITSKRKMTRKVVVSDYGQ